MYLFNYRFLDLRIEMKTVISEECSDLSHFPFEIVVARDIVFKRYRWNSVHFSLMSSIMQHLLRKIWALIEHQNVHFLCVNPKVWSKWNIHLNADNYFCGAMKCNIFKIVFYPIPSQSCWFWYGKLFQMKVCIIWL